MFFSYKNVPLFTLLAIFCILFVYVYVLGVFLDPVCAKMRKNIVRTMFVHHMIVESMFCYKILAFITLSTFAVSRFNGAEWTDSIR